MGETGLKMAGGWG